MATIAFRTFVDVYDDTDNEYTLYIPSTIWDKLVSQFDSTKEVTAIQNKPRTGIVQLSGFAGELYGQDWWDEIEDDLLVCYAGQGIMEIVHKDCEDVSNYNR